jgi:hypothetical protein
MTTPVCRVTSCDHPITDAWVCQRCAHQLERALGDIPAVVHQLNLTLAKQTRYADRNERGGNEQPLPMDPAASAASSDLLAHLVAWVRLIAETRGIPLPAAPIYNPGGNPGLNSMSRWMLAHVEWLRHHEAGADCVDEITSDMRVARRVIDVPANKTKFAVPGPCPEFAPMVTVSALNVAFGSHCPGEVWAYIPNTDTQPARLECNTCHTIWESWQWMRLGKRIKDREATMKGTAA